MRRFGRLGLLGITAVVALGFLFMWSGVYSVAASRGHWIVTEWLLTFVMRSSVRTHALGIEPPPLDNPGLIALGAGHFHGGCANCHGAPGATISPIARAMLPPPPDLATQLRPWRDRELFWIVKNGIKYTGMPAWVAEQRDDEVWALVAFLRKLPDLDEKGYRDLALGESKAPPQGGQDLTTTVSTAAACGRCHGSDRDAPVSRLVPILHGQPQEFLTLALEAYARGQRASGIMQPVASELSARERQSVAQYYANLKPPVQTADAKSPRSATIERGRILAESGDADAKVPPCATCHGGDALRTYPRLAGQNAPYMSNRLRLWKGGLAAGSPGEAIMGPIAQGLSEQQIEDVSAYFASSPPAPTR